MRNVRKVCTSNKLFMLNTYFVQTESLGLKCYSSDLIEKKNYLFQIPQSIKPEIRLYYESMCPSCKDFDSNYFSKMVSILGPYVDIFTYPYGKATVNIFMIYY